MYDFSVIFFVGFMEKAKKGAVHSPIGALLLRNFSEDVIVGLYMVLKRPVNDESLLFASRVLMRVFQNPHNRSTIINDHNLRLRVRAQNCFSFCILCMLQIHWNS
jgi:hypothetical protein